jgi:hypothetical protein
MNKLVLTMCGILLLCAAQARGEAPDINGKDWTQIKDKHFVVTYPIWEDARMPRSILRKAEDYYDSISERIGYHPYNNFWTWDKRVQIVYYPDQASFVQATGQPTWSKGFSVSHFSSIDLKMIISFKGQEDFLNTVLPHEIGHLILHDFMGQYRVPVWFDEGVAQLEEERKEDAEHKSIVGKLAADQKTIPLPFLNNYSLRSQKDEMQIEIFYAESLYIVDFLIKTYGKESFQQLCRQLRDGKLFEDALKLVYYPTIDSMAALQVKWVTYMMEFIH